MKKQIGINTLVEVLAKVLNFLTSVIIGRMFGPGVFGLVSTAQSIAGYVNLLGDLGTTNETIRRISENEKDTSKTFSYVLVYRAIISIITLSVTIILLLLNVLSDKVLFLFIIVNLLLLFIPNSVFIGTRKFQYNGYVNFINAVSSFILFLILINFKHNITFYPIALIIGCIISIICGLFIYFKKIGTFYFESIHEFQVFIKSAIILGMTGIFARIYYDFDIIMLSILTDNLSVGLYSAAFKIIQILWFLPTMYVTYALPHTSRIVNQELDKVTLYIESILRYAFVFLLPILLVSWMYGEDLLVLIYGEKYYNSYSIFVILIAGFTCMCIKTIFGNIIMAMREEKLLLKLSIIASIFNVLANIFLIPLYGVIGAAVSTLITELILMTIEYRVVKKHFKFKMPLDTLLKVALSVLIVYIILAFTHFNIFIGTLFTILIYTLGLIILKERVMFQIYSILKRN